MKFFVIVLLCLIIICLVLNHLSVEASTTLSSFKTTDHYRGKMQPGINNEFDSVSFFNMCDSNGEEGLCPLWHYCNTSEMCDCGYTFHNKLRCDSIGNTYVLNCFCVTFNNRSKRSEFGPCIFNCENTGSKNIDPIYHKVNTTVSMCSVLFNREGRLCGSCKEGYYPLAYSYNLTCVKCNDTSYNVLNYVVLAFLPLTVFYLVILFFQVSVLHSHLYGFVLYSQAVSFPVMCRISVLGYSKDPYVYAGIKIVGSLYGIWNLDFMRLYNHGTCLRSSILLVNSLDLLVALYPYLLVFLTYTAVHLYEKKISIIVKAIKPICAVFHILKAKFEIRTSLVDAFATFMLLTSVKIYSVSFDTLAPALVHSLNSSGGIDSTHQLYFDASVKYFGSQHMPYAITCFLFLLLFTVLPTLVLTFYPFRFFQTCLNGLPHQLLIFLHTYVDIYYSCFKDGTEQGSRDCRLFASLFIFVRIFLFILYGYTLNIMCFVFGSQVLVVLCILLVLVEPFKNHTKHNVLTTSFLLYLVALYVCVLGIDIAGIHRRGFKTTYQSLFVLVGTAPLIYILFVILSWLHSLKYVHEFIQWIRFRWIKAHPITASN